MHEDRADQALRDDLGVELEQLMAIEPAPDLRVRVRARVTREGLTGWWPLRLQLAAGGVLALMLVVLLGIPQVENAPPPAATGPSTSAMPAASAPRLTLEQNAAARPRAAVPHAAPVKPPARRTSAPARDYPVLVMPPIEPLNQIFIEPVAIEPLGEIAPLSGERQ